MYLDDIRDLTEADFNELRATLDIDQEADRDEVIEFIEAREGAMYKNAYYDIIDSLWNGAYSYAVKQMLEHHISPQDFGNWIEDRELDENGEKYIDEDLVHNVTLTSMVAICSLWETARKGGEI